ncbi:MAG: retron St85 family RNA-directed DNA polymerase [Sulfurimonas sp.]|uniref:retron St85 family RNA-directed DNA polymerase n=1 Tax=Sulfurimonas sp. TaxID=2022749 RepID=UPI0026064ED6|nr:retron St85 family RNA-directed DNA polymerase [Sulfurimonas sp.]MDD5400929.1 retron St85 family RNA-directed DNA polymerase [Sulfurimonas sp.]
MSYFQNAIESEFSETFSYLYKFAYSASRRYKTYSIPKRTSGNRIISQPSRELKSYQRYIISSILEQFPIHESVYSYQNNKNIKKMATNHLNSRFLLRVDFSNFFPSIKGEYLREFFQKNMHFLENPLTDTDITLINLFVFRSNKLTIGAPSSPIISNIILYDLDEYLSNICTKKRVTYTRYADDLYFSTSEPNTLNEILQLLKEYLKDFFIKLLVNEDKNIFTSKKRRRQITGLTLTTSNSISIGKKKKREIRTLIYKYSTNNIELNELSYLKGYLPYLYSIEPSYIDNLKRKYSDKIIQELLPLKQSNIPIK